VSRAPRPPRPFYSKFVWKDWLAKTRHMTPEAKGAYIDLMAWAATASSDFCSVPDDENVLARIAGMSLKRWRKVSQMVLVNFIREPPAWVNQRLREDAESFAQLSAAQRTRRTAGQPGDNRRSTGLQPDGLYARSRDSQKNLERIEPIHPTHDLSPRETDPRTDTERPPDSTPDQAPQPSGAGRISAPQETPTPGPLAGSVARALEALRAKGGQS
jgi:uncharacterized protein YdaU (DUF1376 family)